VNPLQALLNLSESEKQARGLTHTPQETAQQPGSWRTMYQRFLTFTTEITAYLKHAGIDGGNRFPPVVFLIGAGSSDYIGRGLALLLRRQWRTEVFAIPSTDLLTNMDEFRLERDYLWISFSRSGDSREGVAVLERALQSCPKVRHLIVTCSQAGAMARRCASSGGKAMAVVLDDAVNDRGLAMTSSFSNMVVAGHCLAHFKDLRYDEKVLESIIGLATRFLASAAEAAYSISQRECSDACFIGTGALRAVTAESAMKLLELTAGKVHSMHESALGLRHGPMSAIDQNTLYVQFIPGDTQRRNYELDLLDEIRAKKLGKLRVAVTPRDFERLDGAADYILSLDAPADFDDNYRVPLDVILGQLLGLFASIKSGLKPDIPSPGGVINRVVSGVKIYP